MAWFIASSTSRHADQRDKRHHLLFLHEGVSEIGLAEQHLRAGGTRHASGLGQHADIFADQVLIHVRLVVLGIDGERCFRQRDRSDPDSAENRRPSPISPINLSKTLSTTNTCFSPMHRRLLSYAAAFDDRRGGVLQARGFIDNHRRIAGPRDDRALADGERRTGHGRAAGHHQERNRRDD